MIQDSVALSEIQLGWAGVEMSRERLVRSAFTSQGVIAGTFPFSLANAAHNLPFIHAFAVLNDVLEQLASEGHFKCKSHFLGALVANSKTSLPWRDHALISAGVQARNDVAHRGIVLERSDCWVYIDSIKNELSAWRIV